MVRFLTSVAFCGAALSRETFILILMLMLRRFPIDTGRDLNVHKTFNRRLGHLLNVLCTFSLRPVSTGLFEARRSLEEIRFPS